MGRVRDFLAEWSARRAGRLYQKDDVIRSVRAVTGATGNATTSTWNHLESGGKAFQQSFDPRIPPSLYVSERDRLRANQPIPVAERCLEDWPKHQAERKKSSREG